MDSNIKRYLEKINYPILAAVLVICIGSFTLFFKPVVGMANNGDFFRIITQNNLYYLDNQKTKEDYFNYFEKDYGISSFYDDNKKMLISTQSLLIKPAVSLGKLITGNDKVFDLRFLAAILLLVQALGSYLIIKGLIFDLKNPINKLILTLLYIFIFMDTGYIAYFNSFFGEGVIIPFFLLSLGIFMYMIKFDKVTWYNLILFSVSSFIFFGAKQQLAPTGILVSILIIFLIKFYKHKSVAIVGGLLILTLIVSSVFLYIKIEGDFDYINRYHALNRGILLYEKNPEKILEEMGINKQYSLLQGTNYFEDISQINLKDPNLKKYYYNNFTISKILKYYIMHPDKIYKMAKIGFNNAYEIRPEVLGNYERESGKLPGEKSYFFSAWSSLKSEYLPKSIMISIIYVMFLFYPILKNSIKGKAEGNYKEILIGILFLYVFLVGIFQIAISLIGAGDADLSKHEFMYNMSFDMMIILSFQAMLRNRESSLKR